MPIKIERKSWEPNFPHGKVAVSKWDATDIRQFVDFVTKAGLEVPRLVMLRLHNASTVGVAPERKKNEPRNAYRRRVRRWRKEQHGSISKMRAAKRLVQLKEQRWSVLREQGFPLKDPEALIWFMKANVCNEKSHLANYGYLRHSALLEVAGGTLPTGIDFDDVYYRLTRAGWERHADRERNKPPARDERTPGQRYRGAAEVGLRLAYGAAKFRIKHSRDSTFIQVNDRSKTEAGNTMAMNDTTQTKRGRNRHTSEVTVKVDLSWYRKVHKRGLANAAGARSLVLDVGMFGGVEKALVARQPSPSRYALVVSWMKFGKNADGTYWFSED